MKLNTKISYDTPSNAEVWNQLAADCNNLLQSTFCDRIMAFYNHKPVYVEAYDTNNLVAGAKIYIQESSKLGVISKFVSRSALQYGEFLISEHYDSNIIDVAVSTLNSVVMGILHKHEVVSLRTNTYVGEHQLLFRPERNAKVEKHYGIASIELKGRSRDDFYKNMHVKHRNMYNKAVKSGLTFSRSLDFDRFLSLFRETYAATPEKMTNTKYLKHLFESLQDDGLVELFFVQDTNGKDLAAAMVQHFGKMAMYNFGGNINNSLGAGQFLHMGIAEYFAEKGCDNYCLGQVAMETDNTNLKFTEGITRFKNRFGGSVNPGYSGTYVFYPLRHKLWQWATRLK